METPCAFKNLHSQTGLDVAEIDAKEIWAFCPEG